MGEYIPDEVLAENGPREIVAVMYPTIRIMLGELTTLAYNLIKPVIGKFEIPFMEQPELSSVAAHAERFLQCAAALKEMADKREGRTLRSDEVPWYFEKAYKYLYGLNLCPEFDWPATMSFAKMTELQKRKQITFGSGGPGV